eukprot:TRINITY_DN2378_c0_g1_i4.p1 TRINITY_DN2378_c0_g1~~TRINITY_DN2378_c0_g1_i4.p1  ORF type:complete len:131 (-),score=32.72 TRINITY_DN2378_c0_g1_i4:416-763(-)
MEGMRVLTSPVADSPAADSDDGLNVSLACDGCGRRQRTLIIAVTSMNRWDLAGLDVCMDMGIRAGVDAVIPSNFPLAQLRSLLRKFGLRSKYLHVPKTLPRALSGSIHNPLNLSR